MSSSCFHHVPPVSLSTICFHPGTRIVRHVSSFLIIFHDVPSFSTIVHHFSLLSTIFHRVSPHVFHHFPLMPWLQVAPRRRSWRLWRMPWLWPSRCSNNDFTYGKWWFCGLFMMISCWLMVYLLEKNDELIYGTYSNTWWFPTLGVPREFSSISNDGIFPEIDTHYFWETPHFSWVFSDDFMVIYGGFLKRGVPNNGWFVVENPNLKWMITRGTAMNWTPPFMMIWWWSMAYALETKWWFDRILRWTMAIFMEF